MENIEQKAEFLRSEYTKKLEQLDPGTKPLWGKMNVSQMIEHMGDYVRIANGKDPMELVTPLENMPRMTAFLESEKPFRENTPNSLMPDTPVAPKMDVENAIKRLRQELNDFFSICGNDPARKILNPFFGALDYEHNVQLLYKHSIHHLRQFGISV
jgi:hypothetical protein